MAVPSKIIIVYSPSLIGSYFLGGSGAGSKAPLVPALPYHWEYLTKLKLQDPDPVLFLESFDLQVCGLASGLLAKDVTHMILTLAESARVKTA